MLSRDAVSSFAEREGTHNQFLICKTCDELENESQLRNFPKRIACAASAFRAPHENTALDQSQDVPQGCVL